MTDDREYVETAKMEAFGYTVPDGSDDYKKGFQDGVDFVLDRFYDLPREDVEPVIHARWIEQFEGTYLRRAMYCSACKKKSGIGGSKANQMKPYCPNCGAKMDEKEQEKCGG